MKTTRRILSLVLSLILLAGLTVVPAFAEEPAAGDAGEPKKKYGIDYVMTDTPAPAPVPMADVVQGTAVDSNGATSNYGAATDFEIDLVNEVIVKKANDAKFTFISTDAGKKWKTISMKDDGTDISKLLNKESEIWLTDIYDKKGKCPQVYVAATPAGGTEDAPVAAVPAVPGAVVYKFPKIAARPKTPGFKPNYELKATGNGSDNGAWWPAEKGTVVPYEKIEGYDIAVTNDGKTPDDKGWGKISTDGINVQDLVNGKPGKDVFLMRVAPNTSAGSYAPGSKPKKVTATTVLKAPNYKIDYKKALIKPKEGAIYMLNTGGMDMSPFTKESAKAGLALVDETRAEGLKNLYGKTLLFRTVGGKKAASAVQEITIAEPAALYYADAAQQIPDTKGKYKPDKTLEILDKPDSTGKKIGKDATEGYIRIKNTAKYNAKNDATTGEPASRFIKIEFVMGEIPSGKKTKPGIVDIEMEVPMDATDNTKPAAEALLPDEVVLTGVADSGVPGLTKLEAGTPIAVFTPYVQDEDFEGEVKPIKTLVDNNITKDSFEIVVGGSTGLSSEDFELVAGIDGENNPNGTIIVKLSDEAEGKAAAGFLLLSIAFKETEKTKLATLGYNAAYCVRLTLDLEVEPVVTAAVVGNGKNIRFNFLNTAGITFNGKEPEDYLFDEDGEPVGDATEDDISPLFTVEGVDFAEMGGTKYVSAAYIDNGDGEMILIIEFSDNVLDTEVAVTNKTLTLASDAFKLNGESVPITITGGTKFQISQAANNATPTPSAVTITAAT